MREDLSREEVVAVLDRTVAELLFDGSTDIAAITAAVTADIAAMTEAVS